MAFPAFDLAKAIQQHNEIYDVRIPETATFGFHFFANDAKKFVQEREEYIHDLAAIFVFSKKDSLAYKALRHDKKNSSSADIDTKPDDFKNVHRLSVIAAKRDNTLVFIKIKAKALLELEGSHRVQKRLEKDTTLLDQQLFARIATTEIR